MSASNAAMAAAPPNPPRTQRADLIIRPLILESKALYPMAGLCSMFKRIDLDLTALSYATSTANNDRILYRPAWITGVMSTSARTGATCGVSQVICLLPDQCPTAADKRVVALVPLPPSLAHRANSTDHPPHLTLQLPLSATVSFASFSRDTGVEISYRRIIIACQIADNLWIAPAAALRA